MAEGVKTYMGLAVPLFGESEIVQETAATDILTITGAASQAGDFLVCQNSTGGENLVISSSGQVTSVVGMSMTSLTATGAITNSAVSSSSIKAGVEVTVSSTGAIAAGAVLVNGFLVSPSSKANMNVAYGYQSNESAVGVTNYLLGCHGSKSPDYFLGIGATAVGVGGATDNGFVNAGIYLTSAVATTVPMVGLKVKFGDSVFYVMCITETAMS